MVYIYTAECSSSVNGPSEYPSPAASPRRDMEMTAGGAVIRTIDDLQTRAKVSTLYL